MRKKYYQDDEEAEQNIFNDDEEFNWGANHRSDNLPDDNAITYQDPDARLGIDLA